MISHLTYKIDNYQILNEFVQNLKADIPRVKIEALKKELHKFTSLKEKNSKIENSNYSTQQTSVSIDDSSACITNSINLTSENYSNTSLEDKKKLDKPRTPFKNYNIAKSSSTKCILRTQSNTPTVSYHMNSKKSLNKSEINENKNLDEDENINVKNVFDKVVNNGPTIISNVPFSTTLLVLPANSIRETSLNESDLLSKSQISILNKSIKSINNELTWSWEGNELVVPQCKDIEDKQLEELAFRSNWNNNGAILNDISYDLTEQNNLDTDCKQLYEENLLVNSSVKYSQNNDNFSDSHSEYSLSEYSSEKDDEYISNNTSANKISRKSDSFNNSGLNISLTNNIHGKSSCNDEEMYIESAPPKGSKRTFRKHFCLFCKTWQSKISRHLERKHKEEKRVKDFSDLPKKSSERKNLINMLRKQGDFYYNINNDVNSGKLIICRRPAEKSKNTAQDYTACPKCKGFFNKLNLRHHTAHCIDQKRKGTKVCNVLSRQIMGRYASQADNILRQIVMPRCRDDRITRLIRYDQLINMEINFV